MGVYEVESITLKLFMHGAGALQDMSFRGMPFDGLAT